MDKKKNKKIKKYNLRDYKEQPQDPTRAAPFGLGASGCSPRGGSRAPASHSVFPDTNQIQQHKHIQGQGAYSLCVCIYERETATKRKTSRGRRGETEEETEGKMRH